MAEDNPFSSLFPSRDRYNPTFDPNKSGTLTGLIGGLTGAPTAEQAQGGAVGRASAAIAGFRAQGQSPQQAAMSFFNSPEGQDFFANAGPEGMKRLGEAIAMTQPPAPTVTNLGEGGSAIVTDREGKLVNRFDNPRSHAPTVLKPGDMSFSRDGQKMNENTNVDPALEPAEVRTFKYLSSVSKLPPEELSRLAKLKLDPSQADKSTAATQAIDEMVEKFDLDPRTAAALRAGTLKLLPLKDGAVDTGSFALVDISNPAGGSVIINPKGNRGTNAASSGAPSVASSTGVPQAVPGTSPETGGAAGVLPPAEPKTIPQRNPKYFGDKASMFLGSGVIPSAMSAAGNISEQLNPGMVMPEAAKADDRQNLINIVRNSLSAMGQLGEGISVNKGTVESYLKLAPTGSMGENAYQAVQKAIRLHEKVTEEIQAEEATLQNDKTTVEVRKGAAKRKDGWERVLRTLPTYEELSRIEEDLRTGKSEAPTLAKGVKELANQAGKALTEGKKQAKEVIDEQKGQDFDSMTQEQLIAIDPRKLSRQENIKYLRAIDRLLKGDKRSEGERKTQVAQATVTPLHPPGTFSRNTQGGDVINGVARQLGISPPNNVIRFPSRRT